MEQWKKVRSSDESRFTVFLSDGCIRVINLAVPIMPCACCKSLWGQCYDLGCFSWSGLSSENFCVQNNRSTDDLNTLNAQAFSSIDFSFIYFPLMARAYPTMTMPASIRSNYEKVVQGTRHNSHMNWRP